MQEGWTLRVSSRQDAHVKMLVGSIEISAETTEFAARMLLWQGKTADFGFRLTRFVKHLGNAIFQITCCIFRTVFG